MIEPWQDVSIRVHDNAASDVALNFIHRWEHVRQNIMELLGEGLCDDHASDTPPPRIKLLLHFSDAAAGWIGGTGRTSRIHSCWTETTWSHG